LLLGEIAGRARAGKFSHGSQLPIIFFIAVSGEAGVSGAISVRALVVVEAALQMNRYRCDR
jgi:hypothetical protein